MLISQSSFVCEVSVPILWTSIQNYNTLIACLPNESKEILFKNEIIISTPISKPLLFNYVVYIKSLSDEIGDEISNLLENNQQPITSRLDSNQMIVVTQEIFKMLMNQISLKKLVYSYSYMYIQKIPFTTYPGAIDCLKNLSELTCGSDIYSEFFYQLSPICHNIRSLNIKIRNIIS